MSSLNKDGILARLEQLDGDLLSLYPGEEPFDLIVVGGSAIVLQDLSPNKTQTYDIDALQTSEELESLLARYDINTYVDTFRFKFPAHFENRLVKIPFSGDMLKVFTLSNEDLAITKLIAWRRQDQEDLMGMVEAGNVNMAELRGIIGDISELAANFDDEEWAAFISRFKILESWAG